MSRLFLTAADHMSRGSQNHFRFPCADRSQGGGALAAEFFGVSFLSPATYHSTVFLALSKSGPSRWRCCCSHDMSRVTDVNSFYGVPEG